MQQDHSCCACTQQAHSKGDQHYSTVLKCAIRANCTHAPVGLHALNSNTHYIAVHVLDHVLDSLYRADQIL